MSLEALEWPMFCCFYNRKVQLVQCDRILKRKIDQFPPKKVAQEVSRGGFT